MTFDRQRWDALAPLRRLIAVELEPRRAAIHITPCCAEDSDRVQVVTYDSHMFLSVTEAQQFANALQAAAKTTASGMAASPDVVEQSRESSDARQDEDYDALITAIAGRALSHFVACGEWELWEDFPEIGQDDWLRVEREITRLAQSHDVSQRTFDAAYKLFAGRAANA